MSALYVMGVTKRKTPHKRGVFRHYYILRVGYRIGEGKEKEKEKEKGNG